jgi:hypothetical protein
MYWLESRQVSEMLGEWIVFNDPDDDRFVQDDEPLAMRYLDESIIDEYFVFRNIANGSPSEFRFLYHDTSRLEMFRIYAMNLTYFKERNFKG